MEPVKIITVDTSLSSLLNKCNDVNSITEEIRQDIFLLKNILLSTRGGAGLAAPQIGTKKTNHSMQL